MLRLRLSNEQQAIIQPVWTRYTPQQREQYKQQKILEYQNQIDNYSPNIWLPQYSNVYNIFRLCPGFRFKKSVSVPQTPTVLQTPLFTKDPPEKRKPVSWVNKTRKIIIHQSLENHFSQILHDQFKLKGKVPTKTDIKLNLARQLAVMTPQVNINPERNLRVVNEDLSRERHTRAIQIQLHPTQDQKIKLKYMFDAFIQMYNIALSFIRQGFEGNRQLKLILKRDLDKTKDNVFTLCEKTIKQQLLSAKNALKTEIESKSNCIIYTHMLDEAVSLVISNYKSAFSNYKRTRKPFRIRFWKQNKENKIIKIESDLFRGYAQLLPNNEEKRDFKQKNLSGFFIESLGQHMEATLAGSPFDLMMIPSTATLVYNEKSKTYILNVPIHFQDDRTILNFLRKRKTKPPQVNKVQKNLISLDPGIRTFLTGFGDNEVIKIGEDFGERIYKLLLRKARNRKDQQKIKREVANRLSTKSKSYFPLLQLRKELKLIYKKLTYLSDELHWKTIGFLTRNYKTILIGNMSTKKIVNNNRSVLCRMTKQKAYALGLYKFKQRLIARCDELNINYREVDEFNTSKTCSNCGWMDENLKDAKIFKCRKMDCKVITDRDVNGARGIYIKSLN